jgi:hypothetical protein
MVSPDLHAQIQELTVEIAVLKSQLQDDARALEKQAREYERRLGELNHAHARALETAHNYVTRDIHDQINRELGDRISRNETELVSIRESMATSRGKSTAYAAMAAAVFGVLTFMASIWRWIESSIR